MTTITLSHSRYSGGKASYLASPYSTFAVPKQVTMSLTYLTR